MGKFKKFVAVVKHADKAYDSASETHEHLKNGKVKHALKSAAKTVKHTSRAVARARELSTA